MTLVPSPEDITQSLDWGARTFCLGDRNCGELEVASTKVKPMTCHDCLQKDGYLQKKNAFINGLSSVDALRQKVEEHKWRGGSQVLANGT